MYVERRWQPWWLLGLLVTIALSLGIAYGSAISSSIGWLVAVVTTAPVIYFWYSQRSHILVTPTHVRVGQLVLELSAISEVEEFDRENFLIRIRNKARADDMISLRGSNRGGVVISLNDPTDPIKAWVLSSRNPPALTAAIKAALSNVG